MTVRPATKLCCAMALLCACSYAQTMAALQGTVTDPDDSAVPGISVEAKNVATGMVRSSQTNAEGYFRFDSMPPAVYNLTISGISGFKTLQLNNIDLTPTETRDLGRIKLALGALREEVQVTAETIAVQTTSSENSKLVDSTQIENITIRGRDMFAILQTIPGVYTGNMYLTQGGGGETSQENALQTVRINGGASGGVNFQVDGVYNLPQSSASTTDYEPTIDSIAEMRVLTTNYQAEYGRTSGGAILVVTKSGSQEFHGGAQANKRHEMFNAKNFFTNYNGQTKPQYRFFIWSYHVGGPVYIPHVFNTQKKKLFFFWSQEYTRQKPGPSTGYANVPNANQRKGDFSYYTNSNGQIIANSLRDPTTGKYFTPSAGNPALADFSQYLSSFDSQSEKWGQAMLNFFPTPNLCNAAAGTSDGKPWNGVAAGATGSNLISPGNCPAGVVAANPYLATGNIDAQGGPGTANNNTRNYYWQFQGTHPRRNDTLRIDYNVTSNFTAYARYGSDYDVDGTAAQLPMRDSTGTFNPTQILHPFPGHGYAVGMTYTFTPNLVNEFTWGEAYTSWDYYPKDPTQLDRSQLGNPPSFNKFSTDPNFVNDQGLKRPTQSNGNQNYMIGIPSVAFGGGQLTEASINNSCSGQCPYTNWTPVYSLHDSVSAVRGRHNLKTGLYYEWTELVQQGNSGSYLGSYNFGGNNVLNPHDAGDGWVNAYLGQINQYSEGSRTLGDYYTADFEFFAQDNWRVSRRLTLDLGVRFYHMPEQQNRNNTSAMFARATYNPAAAERIFFPFCTVSTATAPCPSNTATTIYQYAWDKVGNPNGIIGSGQGGVGNMYPTNLSGTLVPVMYNGLSTGGYTATPDPFTGMQVATPNNPNIPYSLYKTPFLSPAFRFGFAWDVFGNGKTAIRGGIGQFLNRTVGNTTMGGAGGQSPVNVNMSQNFGGIASLSASPLAYSNGTRPAANLISGLSPLGPTTFWGTQKYESSYSGSFMIQQRIGFSSVLEAAWVTNLRRHIPITRSSNNVVQMFNQFQPGYINPMMAYLAQYIGQNANNASGMAYSDNYFRPLQGYGAIRYYDFAGSADYHALQVTLRRNFTRNISYGLAYNFSKYMGGSNRNGLFTDKFRDWGASYLPTPHTISFNYVLQEPEIAERYLGFKPLGWLINGWSISGLTQWRSNIMTGYPGFSFTNTNSTTLVALNNTGTSVEGATALVLGNPILDSSQVSFVGGPTTTNIGVNGTPGNQIFNLAAVRAVYPCSYTPQANPRLGIGQDMECFGNAGPGSLFPIPNTGIFNWDMTFTKEFPIRGEGRALEFRLETYNIFNHTQFTGASLSQSYGWQQWRDNGILVPQNGGAGRYTTAAQPRIMSFTVRFTF